VPDLIVLATAKYLLEFFDIPRERLFIVTTDQALKDGAALASDLPNALIPRSRAIERKLFLCSRYR
jgi:hypothetical protein